MRDVRANTTKIWYSVPSYASPETDGNGDFTGEFEQEYSNVRMKRMTLSPYRGSVDDDYFGASLNYSASLTTADMTLPITEGTLMWDEEQNPEYPPDCATAKYVVVAIARGKYHMRYAVNLLNREVEVPR